jgi:tetratricopeptide (TPR) repeat protein
MWVLWAHASSTARLEQSFHDIADRVKIEGRRDSLVNIFKLVHDWMCDTNERWLLVLDNVDDAGFLFDTQATTSKMAAKPLHEYLPYCAHGSVLVTTRNKEAALQLVEQRDIIALDPMNALQARTLLTKKLGVQAAMSNAAELTELATVLEHMPLALVQAAAYISQRAPLCSVAQYLNQFRKSERKRTSLLSYDKDHLRRDWEAKNSIITTWQISFEYIQQTRPSAADLLSLMSFFDRQGIPRNVLQTQAEHEEDKHNRTIDKNHADRSGNDNVVQFECTDGNVENQSWNDSADDFDDDDVDDTDYDDNVSEDDAFFEDFTALRNFSFISVSTDGTTFEMHALVQLSMRTWLEANGRLGRYKDHFIKNLCEAFPTGEYENWTACQALFAHAKAAAGHKPEAASSLVQWATLLYRAAWYALRKGSAGEAEMLATQSLKARKKVLGRDHEDTIWGLAMVASAYNIGGKWDAAEELEVQVMETRKTKLGADHPSTLTSMANLASTYRKQGRWEEAEKLDVQVMETRKTKLGADHPDTLTSMNNLASTFWKQGRWEEAEKLEVQVMETRKTKLGADHPDTLTSINNLATTYIDQGRWEEAEKLDVQVIEKSKTKLGADHPDTLNSINNLATIFMNQGRWEEAEKLYAQVIEICKTKLGADHPSTLTSMNNLAFTWKSLGQTIKAICLMQQCVQRCEQVLGASHPHYLSSLLVLERWEREQADVDLCNRFKDMRL